MPTVPSILCCGPFGGGVDGAYSAGVAQAIAATYPGFPACVSLWAGTSIGSMTAAMLAVGHSPADVVAVFQNQGSNCFTRDELRKLGHGAIYAKWDGCGMASVLQGVFGTMTIGNVPKPLVLATTRVSGIDAQTVLLNNLPDSPWLSMTVVDACMASAAAPFFFPMRAIANPDTGSVEAYADGGLGTNSPGLAAIDLHRSLSVLTDEDYALLDLGTGTNAIGLTASNLDIGLLTWLPVLASTFIDAQESVEEGEAGERFGRWYVPILGLPTGQDSVDDAGVIPQRIADGLATDVSAAVNLLAAMGL